MDTNSQESIEEPVPVENATGTQPETPNAVPGNGVPAEQFMLSIENLKNELLQKLDEQNEYLESLRKFSAAKETELRRWRECYDMRIKQNFITRLMEIASVFDSKIESAKAKNVPQEHLDDLKFMRKCLLDELDGEGIVQFGEEFLQTRTIPENARGNVKIISVETTEKSLDGNIFELQEHGFKLLDGNGEKLLRPATLLRYKFVR